MSRIKLPPQTQLMSSGPVALDVANGAAFFAKTPQFPNFFIVLSEPLGSLYEGTKLPAVITPSGLETDPAWDIFHHFFTEDDYRSRGPDDRVVSLIKEKKTKWSCTCPVIEGHKSVIGQLIRQYGELSAAVPFKETYDVNQLMRGTSIASLLRHEKAQTLIDFRDGELTLLDLATRHQQWHLADFLWDKGVRWSEADIQKGEPLGALILGSKTLQRSSGAAFLSELKKDGAAPSAIEWLGLWLDRWKATGAPLPTQGHLDWRARVATLGNHPSGHDIRDTPASLWAQTCIEPVGPHIKNIKHATQTERDLISAWSGFWATNGVDLFSLPIPKNDGSHYAGIQESWSFFKSYEGWMDFIQMHHQASVLELKTQGANAKRAGPRL